MENPPFFHPSYYNSQFTSDNAKNTDHFVVEDLLDFPNDDTMLPADAAPFTDSSSATPVHSSSAAAEPFFQPHDVSAHHAFADAPFGNELCVPYDDLAELEWVSNFVDESFASEEDLHKVQLMQGMKARNDQSVETHQYHFQPEPTRSGPMLSSEMSVPAKARSKRSRAAPGNWTSRLLVLSPTPTPEVPAMSSSSESDITGGKKSVVQKKKEFPDNSGGGEGRKCLHCATDKTPQWRTGPLGPKTLCNACGVRYKSGRLVPEYRPAASPTFVLTKHSNSHRKVLELRRQKEMMRAQQHQQQYLHHHQNMMFDITNGDDYLIHQHIGPDYRQLI